MGRLLDDVYDCLEGSTKYGRYIHSLCPFHPDTRPSFFVYEDYYHCKSCGINGRTENLLDDLKKKQGTFLISKQHSYFHSPWKSWNKLGSLEKVIRMAHDNLINNNKIMYLSTRGITIETIQKLNLGWLDDWITFPIYDEYGYLIGATARAGETNKSTAKYCNVPDMSPNTLYVPDWKMVKLQDKVYLTFGIIDAVTLTQLGYAGISTTTGKQLDFTSLDNIRKRIIIIPDRGEEKEAVMLASQLGWRGSVAKIDWPDNCKDINDLHIKDGVKKWLSP